MRVFTHRFISFDKTAIFYYRAEPSSQLRANLIIVHGMGEHGGRYLEFAEYLSRSGIQTFAADLRGFGQSGGAKGYANNLESLFEDLRAIHSLAHKNSPAIPIFLLGHSFGGLLAGSYAASSSKSSSLAGLIFSSPLLKLAIQVPGWEHYLAIGLSYLFPKFTLKNRVPVDKLTHDKSILNKRSNDPHIQDRISLNLYRLMHEMMNRLEEEGLVKSLSMPTLILQAEEDHVVSKEASRKFFERLLSKNKTFEIINNSYHEILQETDRSKNYKLIESWMNKIL